MLDIAIVGGGLSGLSLARRLLQGNRNIGVYESADRPGGRIYSCKPACLSATDKGHGENTSGLADLAFRYDLGPGWIWPGMQPRLAEFIRQYDVEVFSQWYAGQSLYHAERLAAPQRYTDHETYAAARRIKGGTGRLIEVLLQDIPLEVLNVNHHLLEVIDQRDHVELSFRTGTVERSVKARQVVLTIPPRVLADTVSFSPGLDKRMDALMRNTSTWMAGHAKAAIYYPHAFWREKGLSGSAISPYQGAALFEIFDACSVQAEHAVLSGFFAIPPGLRTEYRADLDALIIEQLVRLFGKEAAHPEEIMIKDWFDETRTATQADEIPPATHPQYGHAWLQLDHWNDKLFFAGTETAPQFGGYLEGALEATERVVRHLQM